MPNLHPGVSRTIRHFRHVEFTSNDFVPYPEHWPKFYNGATNMPCNMLSGPCDCGAFHSLEEWIPQKLERAALAISQ